MKGLKILLVILLIFGTISCKNDDSWGEPYLEFLSPSDENISISSKSNYLNPITITLKTNRNVTVTSVDSSSNNAANWIGIHTSQLHKETVNLIFTVDMTLIKRAATITITTEPKNVKDNKQTTLKIHLRQSSINPSLGGTIREYVGGLWTDAKKIEVCGKIDASDIHYMNRSMQELIEIDLRDATIVEYTGIYGPVLESLIFYPANEMPQNSFAGNDRPLSIILPSNLAKIGKKAFADCGIENINIPVNTTSIEELAFWSCEKLTAVNLHANLTSIGKGAFMYCRELTTISLPDNLTLIQDETFAFCDKLSSVQFPLGLTSIGEGAFLQCYNLLALNFPIGLKSIGNSAFIGCNSLNSISFPIGLNSIGNSAFAGSALTELHLPNGLTSIGTGSFSSCDGLKSIVLPESLTSIGSDAFGASRNIEEIICYSIDPSNMEIHSGAFSDIVKSTCILKVPSVALESYKTASVWKDFKNIQAL